jgi:transposase
VVLDGHPSHRAKKVAAWVAARAERIRMVFLPPYSPDLNPAELLNNDVKGNAQRAGRARDKTELSGKVRSYLQATQRMAQVVRNYFRGKHVKYAA